MYSPQIHSARIDQRSKMKTIKTEVAAGDQRCMGSSRPTSPVNPSPHFFKIIHSPHQNLKIPRKFTTTYGKDLANQVSLKVPDGMVWKVELIKSDEDAWLCNGWKEFTEHYSVRFGHFLVFRYDGDSTFYVIIFDMSASEIEYPFSATCDDETNTNHMRNSQVPDTEEIEEDVYGKISTELKLPIPYGKKAFKHQQSGRGLSIGKRPRHYPFTVKKPFSSGYSIALERARAFRSENPYFAKIMSQCCVSTGYLCYLPTKFSKENLSEKVKKVILQSANGGVWPVRCHYGGRNAYALYWKSFVQSNNLKVNDVCVFELINKMELCLNVVIFRKYQNAALEE